MIECLWTTKLSNLCLDLANVMWAYILLMRFKLGTAYEVFLALIVLHYLLNDETESK